jgi:hypothetical protein
METIDFSTILREALTRSGIINEAYRAFHNYSIGNQMLAAMQLLQRGLPLSPIASFRTWKEKGPLRQEGTEGNQTVHAGHHDK